MRALIAAISIGLFIVRPTAEAGQVDTGLCEVVRGEDQFEGRVVTFNAHAEAGSHGHEIALVDSTCENQSILVLAKENFSNNADFMGLMKALYPNYPDSDADTERQVAVRVSGTLVFRKVRGLRARFLDLQQIRVVDENKH